jgi:hypothetical protein
MPTPEGIAGAPFGVGGDHSKHRPRALRQAAHFDPRCGALIEVVTE